MNELIKRGCRTVQNEGILTFGKKAAKYTYRKFVDEAIWQKSRLRGSVKHSINSTSAQFVAQDRESTEATSWRISTERDQLNDLLNEIREDDIFFDIGANTGIYSCFAAQVCDEVVAFEPYPPNVTELEKNIDLNEGKVSLIEKALSNETKTERLSTPEEDEPGHGHASLTESDDSTIEIDSVRGDELVKSGEVPQPNVVKIDVEGAEPLVVEGLEKTLRDNRCRVIYCEFHLPAEHRQSVEDFGSTVPELWKTIEELGFEVKTVWGRGSPDFHMKAVKKDE